jgi:hypothetical protein
MPLMLFLWEHFFIYIFPLILNDPLLVINNTNKWAHNMCKNSIRKTKLNRAINIRYDRKRIIKIYIVAFVEFWFCHTTNYFVQELESVRQGSAQLKHLIKYFIKTTINLKLHLSCTKNSIINIRKYLYIYI